MLLTLPARGRDWWIEYEKVHSILHRRAQGPDRRRPIIEEISLFSTDVLGYNSWYLRFSAFSGPGKGLRHGTKHRTSRQWYRNEVISARYIILRTSKSDIKLGFFDLTLCHLALIPSEERRLSRIRQHESTWSCVFFHYSRDIRARPQSFSLPNIWHGLSRGCRFRQVTSGESYLRSRFDWRALRATSSNVIVFLNTMIFKIPTNLHCSSQRSKSFLVQIFLIISKNIRCLRQSSQVLRVSQPSCLFPVKPITNDACRHSRQRDSRCTWKRSEAVADNPRSFAKSEGKVPAECEARHY